MSFDAGPSNAYVLLSAVLLSGFHPSPEQQAESPATDLSGALKLLENDDVFGQLDIIKCYIAVKRAELEVKTTLPVLLERF